MLKIFGAVGSGSIPIEATLTLLGIPHEVIEAVTWEDEAARKRVETVNPLRQVPALVLPSGEIMTESAAILIYFADLYPQARLAPGFNDPKRAQYLRWMAYVSAAIYAFAWIKDDAMRIAASKEDAPAARSRRSSVSPSPPKRWRDAAASIGSLRSADCDSDAPHDGHVWQRQIRQPVSAAPAALPRTGARRSQQSG